MQKRLTEMLHMKREPVGIYFGNNYILHTASDFAVLEPISSLRWSYYISARRII